MVTVVKSEWHQVEKRYSFDFDDHICIVTGNETTGVPVEILNNSEKIYIPMDGVGFSLNTSQAANIAAYEAVKQYRTLYSKSNEKMAI